MSMVILRLRIEAMPPRIRTAIIKGAAAKRHASHVPLRPELVFPAKAPSAPSSTSSTGPKPTAKGKSASLSSTASLLPKPRLDLPKLLSSPEATTSNHRLRASGLDDSHVFNLNRLRTTQLMLMSKLEAIRGKQRDVGQLIRSGAGDADEARRQAKKLKTKAVDYEKTLAETEAELLDMGLLLPNWTHPASPVGAESNAAVLETFGPEPLPASSKRDHLDIANHFGLVDNDASTLAAGSSWVYLRGALALLEMALVNYALSIAVRRGWEPVATPDVVKVDLANRCGFQPRDPAKAASQTYFIRPGDGQAEPTHCLAGTAEIPLSGLFANAIHQGNSLPAKVVGVGRAFRAEAGARGADTRGLYRVHQFTKVELFAVTEASYGKSEEMMEEMRDIQTEVAKGLGLSVRVLDMPTEELGASAFRKYDMEAWMPGRGKWGEITSTSNCTDYQSRRLHIRYRPSSPSNSSDTLPFAHTLNGTCAAIPRLLVALLENGARFDANSRLQGLDLPMALKPFWVGGDRLGDGRHGEEGDIRWV